MVKINLMSDRQNEVDRGPTLGQQLADYVVTGEGELAFADLEHAEYA